MSRDEMIEKLAEALSRDMDQPISWNTVAAAVLDLCGPAPLVWCRTPEATTVYAGPYSICETPRGYFVIFINGEPLDPVKHGAYFGYGLLDLAQSAAQAHANAAHWAATPLGKRRAAMSALRFEQFTDRAREEKTRNDEGKTE